MSDAITRREGEGHVELPVEVEAAVIAYHYEGTGSVRAIAHLAMAAAYFTIDGDWCDDMAFAHRRAAESLK
jgi:hypothetical protein